MLITSKMIEHLLMIYLVQILIPSRVVSEEMFNDTRGFVLRDPAELE